MTNILVVIDPEETEQSALERVKKIPVSADINFKVDYYLNVPRLLASNASSTASLIQEEREWLEKLVVPLRESGYKIVIEVIPFERLYEAIIKSALKFQADFVFKPMRQHSGLQRVFYTSNDWNLIRMCPTPLLMVSDEASDYGRPVVAAVDVGDKGDSHQQLNDTVLEQAGLLASVLNSEIHVVHAYGPDVIVGRGVTLDPMAYQITHDRHDFLLEATRALAEAHNIPGENVHLLEGSPAIMVNQYAAEVDAGVIVLGTVARSGAAGLFIGNTAERVLERAATDVFVVKIPGFRSPIR